MVDKMVFENGWELEHASRDADAEINMGNCNIVKGKERAHA